MKEFPFVEVIWRDAVSAQDWRDADHWPKSVKIITRGWLVHENDLDVVISATHHTEWTEREGDEEFGEIIAIPKGMIVSQKELTIGYA